MSNKPNIGQHVCVQAEVAGYEGDGWLVLRAERNGEAFYFNAPKSHAVVCALHIGGKASVEPAPEAPSIPDNARLITPEEAYETYSRSSHYEVDAVSGLIERWNARWIGRPPKLQGTPWLVVAFNERKDSYLLVDAEAYKELVDRKENKQ